MSCKETLLWAAVVAVVGLSTEGCGGPLYAPCDSAFGCGDGQRCIDVDGNGGICTRPCTIRKDRAGYPDALDPEPGEFDPFGATAVDETVTAESSKCSDGDVLVSTEDR